MAEDQSVKRDRFERVWTKRKKNLLDTIRKMGNCSNKAGYSWDNDEVTADLNEIGKALSKLAKKFKIGVRDEDE